MKTKKDYSGEAAIEITALEQLEREIGQRCMQKELKVWTQPLNQESKDDLYLSLLAFIKFGTVRNFYNPVMNALYMAMLYSLCEKLEIHFPNINHNNNNDTEEV